MTTAQDSSITLTPGETKGVWCVYEHWMTLTPGAPPSVIFVGACKLSNVYDMTDARHNSEWTRLTSQNAPVIIRIIATDADKQAAQLHAVRHTRTFDPMPRCNLYGYNLFGASRAVICSNGQIYRNQTEAARALDLTQSAISQHLAGKLGPLRGLTFAWHQGEPTP